MLYESAIIIPVIVGVIQVIKGLGVPNKYSPILALGLGVASAFLFYGGSVSNNIMQGVIYGLSASGLFSAGKSAIKNKIKVVK